MPTPVVTFDAGHTLIEPDLDFLASRLRERGVLVGADTLHASAPAAWRRYDELAPTTTHPWHELVVALLAGAGVSDPEPLAEWLWSEQPRKNLWRKPIEPMIELARELAGRGVRVAVLSNSEGHLAELLREVGIADPFTAVIDSGVFGIAKPDPRIFAHTLEVLGMPDARPVHIGDSWSADVEGALAAGWHAIWYRSRNGRGGTDARVRVANDASEARAALASFGI